MEHFERGLFSESPSDRGLTWATKMANGVDELDKISLSMDEMKMYCCRIHKFTDNLAGFVSCERRLAANRNKMSQTTNLFRSVIRSMPESSRVASRDTGEVYLNTLQHLSKLTNVRSQEQHRALC
ncbi:hypothetical protein ACJJTC_007031 [Scirpophaga incertulas]